MFLKKLSAVFLFLVFFEQSLSANILGLFMGLGRHHYILGKAFMKNLVQSGHNCVLISRYLEGTSSSFNYREIMVHNDEHSDYLYKATVDTNNNPFASLYKIHNNSINIIPRVFEEPQVKLLLNESFDIVVVEEVFVDALKVFAWYFNAHLVIFHPHRANFWVNDYMGNPCLPGYISQYPTNFKIPMSFTERVINIALYIYENLFQEFVNLKKHKKISKMYFPDSPDLSEIVYNASLVFLNSDISVHQPIPTLPSMIDIGGFHIETPKSLPKDVFEFFNNSTKGVVYLDMDFLMSSYITEDKQKWMAEVLAEFDYDFLWVWDEDSFPDKPSNLRVTDPIPLGNVLAHPKTKLLIHLGNTKDIIEAVYYGVPQLLIPVLDDQLYDTAQAQNYKYAITLPFHNINRVQFRSALQDLLNNTIYGKEVKRRSKILKEKIYPGKKVLQFWIQNILDTDGEKDSRSVAFDYPWYKLYMIDVLALFLGGSFLSFGFFIMVMLKLFKVCCCYKPKKKINKRKSYNSLNSYVQ